MQAATGASHAIIWQRERDSNLARQKKNNFREVNATTTKSSRAGLGSQASKKHVRSELLEPQHCHITPETGVESLIFGSRRTELRCLYLYM